MGKRGKRKASLVESVPVHVTAVLCRHLHLTGIIRLIFLDDDDVEWIRLDSTGLIEGNGELREDEQ